MPSTRTSAKSKATAPVAATSKTRKAPTKRARSPDGEKEKKTDKRAKTDSAAPTKSTTQASLPIDSHLPSPPPNFLGNFDLYMMSLPFLKEPYLSGNTLPQYEKVYDTILTYQAKNDNTARCYLVPESDKDGSRFESRVIQDPMEDMPFDIAFNSITRQPSMQYTKAELGSFAAPTHVPQGPGITAVTALAEGHCGIQSASGVFKMKRVWTKGNLEGDFMELFEGFFSFNVSHSAMYRRKGHGGGEKVKFAFWGVRARRDNTGKEIGLCPMLPVPLAGPAEVPAAVVVPDTLESTIVDQSAASLAPKFSGNFDAYAMALEDDLNEAYFQGTATPHFEEVFNAIAKTTTAHAAQIYLASSDSLLDLEDIDGEEILGRMKGPGIVDPFVQEPYDMFVTSVETESLIEWTDDELMQFPERDSDPVGPGINAKTILGSDGHHGMVQSAGGYIKLARVWSKVGANGQLLELFEGYCSLEVVYEWKFMKKGHGQRGYEGFSFWAVRAKKDENGNEIGLISQGDDDCGY